MVTLGTGPRPLGITILAILGFIGTVIGLLVAAAFFIGAAFAATILSSVLGSVGGGIVALAAVIVGVIVLIAALIEGLISWGLWSGKNWARLLLLIIYVLGILGALGSIAARLYAQVVPLIIYILLIYYLTRPGVAAYFKPSAMPMQPQMQPPSK